MPSLQRVVRLSDCTSKGTAHVIEAKEQTHPSMGWVSKIHAAFHMASSLNFWWGRLGGKANSCRHGIAARARIIDKVSAAAPVTTRASARSVWERSENKWRSFLLHFFNFMSAKPGQCLW
eukprot:scaffold22831_cov39-Attheya_sp.AAC.1